MCLITGIIHSKRIVNRIKKALQQMSVVYKSFFISLLTRNKTLEPKVYSLKKGFNKINNCIYYLIFLAFLINSSWFVVFVLLNTNCLSLKFFLLKSILINFIVPRFSNLHILYQPWEISYEYWNSIDVIL